MGLMNNVVSLSQFQVIGHPPKDDVEAWLADRLSKSAFQPIDDLIKEQSSGWVCLDDMTDNTFAEARAFLRPPYVCFSLRKDERKVPKSLLTQQVDAACKRWLSEHPDFKFVPKELKGEFRDIAFHNLLKKSLPVPSTFDVVWNTDLGVVSATSLNNKELDAFCKLFEQTFTGTGLLAVHPFARATMVLDPKHHTQLQRLNQAGSDHVMDLINENLWIGNDFLLWLVYNTCESDSQYAVTLDGPAILGEPFVAHVDSRVLAAGQEGEAVQRITFAGPQGDFSEVRSALKSNMQLHEAMIYFEKDDDIYKLTLKGDLFRFASFSCPKVKIERDETTNEIDEREAVFYERMHLLHTGLQMFDSLFAEFLELRLSKKWSALVTDIQQWAEAAR